MTDRLDDRGQLLLVGAIAIALVLLGLVLVINTATFTQVVGSEGTGETTTEGSVSAEELGGAVATTVAQANVDGDDPESDIDAELDSVRSQFVNRSIGGSGAFVDVDYVDTVETGTRVAESGEFSTAEGWPTTEPSADVGGFIMTVDSSDSGTFDLVVENDTATAVLTVTVSGGVVDLQADTPAGTTTCTGIDPDGGSDVRIDVSSGVVYDDPSCRFDLFGPLEPGYWVEFTGPSGVDGSYEFVTNETTSTASPAYSDAVWSFEYAYTYEVEEATAESESREVTVYD